MCDNLIKSGNGNWKAAKHKIISNILCIFIQVADKELSKECKTDDVFITNHMSPKLIELLIQTKF